MNIVNGYIDWLRTCERRKWRRKMTCKGNINVISVTFVNGGMHQTLLLQPLLLLVTTAQIFAFFWCDKIGKKKKRRTWPRHTRARGTLHHRLFCCKCVCVYQRSIDGWKWVLLLLVHWLIKEWKWKKREKPWLQNDSVVFTSSDCDG